MKLYKVSTTYMASYKGIIGFGASYALAIAMLIPALKEFGYAN